MRISPIRLAPLVTAVALCVLLGAERAQATILGQLLRHPSYIFNAVSVIIDPTMRNLATSAAVLLFAWAVVAIVNVVLGLIFSVLSGVFLARYYHLGDKIFDANALQSADHAKNELLDYFRDLQKKYY